MVVIIICVDYSDYLAVTLKRNLCRFDSDDEIIIVTTHGDTLTPRVACKIVKEFNARRKVSVEFHNFGRSSQDDLVTFNKGLAIEDIVQRYRGSNQWIMTLDADIVLHESFRSSDFDNHKFDIDTLYAPFRYILDDIVTDDMNDQRSIDTLMVDHEDWWPGLPTFDDREFAGYCLIFNSSNSVLQQHGSWFGVDWNHAGGYDSEFVRKIPDKVRLKEKCLHLGPVGTNWCRRVSPMIGNSDTDRDAIKLRREALMNRRRR